MMDCRLYHACNAPLCPLDPDLQKRNFFIGEDFCNLPEHRQRPMVRRQRQLNRLAPESYLDKPLKADWLIETARAKRTLTEEQLAASRLRMIEARKSLKTVSEGRLNRPVEKA